MIEVGGLEGDDVMELIYFAHWGRVSVLVAIMCGGCVNSGSGKGGESADGDSTSRWKSLSFALAHVCGIRDTGKVHCLPQDGGMGIMEYGQADAPDGEFTMVSSGDFHTCAVNTDSYVVCWGSDDDGESSPPALDGFVSVSSGETHSCGLMADGSVECWGANGDGESTPPTGVKFLSVAALAASSCGLTTEGELLCWGYEPYFINLGSSLRSIDSFKQLLVAVDADGTPLSDSFGDWGWPDDSPSVETASVGTDGICGLQSDGFVTCASAYESLDVVAPPFKFSFVESGPNCACGILESDDTAMCWGFNFFDFSSDKMDSWRLPIED